jgi:hypothetical protein
MRNIFDWTPVGERWLGIIEPLVADVFDVVVVDVSYSGGDFVSWESSSKLHHLLTDFSIDGGWAF